MGGTPHGGTWTRSGRGSCHIRSLELGHLVRAQVSLNIGARRSYRASVNQMKLRSDYATAEAAKEDVER